MTTSIREALLHYVWKCKQFDFRQLKTESGLPIQIKSLGQHNHNAGPDFLNASIQIGKHLWHGSVEMHIKASDWYKHKHQWDPFYESVILHVVWENDASIHHPNGEQIPCLEIKEQVPKSILENYIDLIESKGTIPCQGLLSKQDHDLRYLVHPHLIIEKWQSKSQQYEQRLYENKRDWEQLFYEQLMYYLGGTVNKATFLEITQILPFTLIKRYRHEIINLEALLLGVAGILRESHIDTDLKGLKKHFMFLQKKHGLHSLPPTFLKYSRMRPNAFPTIRLVLASKLFQKQEGLFSSLMKAKSVKHIRELLSVKIESGFWYSHYSLKSKSNPRMKSMGNDLIDILLINVVLPIRFLYVKTHFADNRHLQTIEWCSQLSPEKNQLTRYFSSLSLSPENAAESQSLIHLKKEYCEQYRCLECRIGHYLLKTVN